MFSITQVRRHAHTEKGRQYFVERFPRFDSSKMHSWFPAWQRLQGGPFSAPTHFIFSRRHTIHALIAHFSIQARGRRATRTVIHASTSVWERRHLCPLLDFQPRRHHRLCGISCGCHRTYPSGDACRWSWYRARSTAPSGECRECRNPATRAKKGWRSAGGAAGA